MRGNSEIITTPRQLQSPAGVVLRASPHKSMRHITRRRTTFTRIEPKLQRVVCHANKWSYVDSDPSCPVSLVTQLTELSFFFAAMTIPFICSPSYLSLSCCCEKFELLAIICKGITEASFLARNAFWQRPVSTDEIRDVVCHTIRC